MSLPSEAPFALVTSLLLLGPLVVFWRAFARTRRVRILWGALGFSVFFGTDLVLFVTSMVGAADSDRTELIEFLGDLFTAACFAAAFLMPVAKADDGPA